MDDAQLLIRYLQSIFLRALPIDQQDTQQYRNYVRFGMRHQSRSGNLEVSFTADMRRKGKHYLLRS